MKILYLNKDLKEENEWNLQMFGRQALKREEEKSQSLRGRGDVLDIRQIFWKVIQLNLPKYSMWCVKK